MFRFIVPACAAALTSGVVSASIYSDRLSSFDPTEPLIGSAESAFFEDFEGFAPPTAPFPSGGAPLPRPSGTWHGLNASVPVGTTAIFAGNTNVFSAHAGTPSSYAGMNFNATTGANAVNVWLMSPTLTFNNGDIISFWTRGPAPNPFPDRLRLRLSTAGSSTDPTSFGPILLTINEALATTPASGPGGYPGAWTQFSVTLSGLSGPTSGRFAFHYDVPNAGPLGDNSNYIGIDSISYIPIPEPTTLGLVALAGLALRRRR